MAAAKKKATAKRAPPKRRTPKKRAAQSEGLDALACALPAGDTSLVRLEAQIVAEGGAILGRYKEPLGGHPCLLAALPIGAIEPTPFQRDLSDAHHKRLAEVIQKTGRFLDPVIAVTSPRLEGKADDGPGFWTPNGRHRLEAMRRLGARAITALVVPTREIAWQILALNTEKAHNLKERALEVVRIYRGLLDEVPSRPESSFAFYLEDASLVTLGAVYESHPRFAGGAYHPILRRVLGFSDAPIAEVIARHEALAAQLVEVEAAVSGVVAQLRERGLVSPYLRSFVVARVNPLRWVEGEPPPAEEVLEKMRARALKMDASKIRQEHLARAGGVADDDA